MKKRIYSATSKPTTDITIKIYCDCGQQFYVPRIGKAVACLECNRVYQADVEIRGIY